MRVSIVRDDRVGSPKPLQKLNRNIKNNFNV